ncbi:CehA/McbA family metallohydrolase [Streptomyces orinoci]|uniref:CehA/McbA family metallohydrolase n=1 Tax=Streptomyces orinoci TaxID=67339 RepID=A0ABV3JYR2_STRON|nr:CehA/McbA family metallohydrolase [Streptomyces orinoci]
MNRRDVLKLTAAGGAAGALTLAPVTFASAEGTASELTRAVTGHLPVGAPDYVYLPVEVPPGIQEIAVSYTYDRPQVPTGTQGNACDIGIFDERGTELGGAGFRGWSGGARSEFAISAERATPGYLPGPVRPGRWHIVLGPYTVAPQGLAYRITITLRPGPTGHTPRPVYPPQRARGRGRAWYRGDSHLHSVYSDGLRTPAEIAAAARAAGLDWIVTTEHNTTSSHAAWQGLWGSPPGDPHRELLILTGEEITTRNGHVLALATDPGVFIDWRYRAHEHSFDRFARAIHRAGGLVVPAHPHATCVGCNWKFGFQGADAVEVWNGPFTPDDEIAISDWDNTLVSGDRWLPAMGNSDAHREPQVVGLPQTVVLAEDLSRPALLNALRTGRSYLAESSAVSLSFQLTDGHGAHADIGGRLPSAPGTPVTARLKVTGATGCTASFITDQGTLFTAPVPSDGKLEWHTTPANAAYVRAEVRHPATIPGLPGPMAAMTNPIFLGRS